jgi:ApbE superfamily uncharacterized protein (UPF0280 family)
VENGGEIMAQSNQPVDVAVAAGEEPLSRRFGFRLTEFPIGVATSSGRFSHAFSFGDAEAATVFCKNASIADAAATAVGNVVKGDDAKAGIQAGISRGLSIDGVEGIMIIYKGEVGTAGKIPQIIKLFKNRDHFFRLRNLKFLDELCVNLETPQPLNPNVALA